MSLAIGGVPTVSGSSLLAVRLVWLMMFPERVSIQATLYNPLGNPGTRSFPATGCPAAGARL